MSTPTGAASSEASTKLPASCPYIGMVSDPQTHVGIPDPRNYCHLVSPPGPITETHQHEACLNHNFPQCPVFLASGEGMIPEGIFDSGAAKERGFGLSILGMRRNQSKTSKRASTDSKTSPLGERKSTPLPGAAAVSAAAVSAEALAGAASSALETPEPAAAVTDVASLPAEAAEIAAPATPAPSEAAAEADAEAPPTEQRDPLVSPAAIAGAAAVVAAGAASLPAEAAEIAAPATPAPSEADAEAPPTEQRDPLVSTAAVAGAAAVVAAGAASLPAESAEIAAPATPAPAENAAEAPPPASDDPVETAAAVAMGAVAVSAPGAASPAAAADPAGTAEDDEEMRIRLYNEAVSRYEQVSGGKRERKGLWVFLLVAALLVLLGSIWGVYIKLQNNQREARLQAEIGYTIGLATAVQDMGAAADAWGTAAGLLQAQQETATAAVIAAEAIAQQATQSFQASQTAAALALTITPTPSVQVCQSISDASMEIISGPAFSPQLGTFYRSGMPRPQVSWVIQNSGRCAWSQLLLWSVLDNTITQPIIKRNGVIVTPSAPGNPTVSIAPGEQIELVLEFPATNATRVNGEWVLVADGLSLVSQPHIVLKNNNWVIVGAVNTPKLTRTPRTPRPDTGTSAKATDVPGVRPTDPGNPRP